MGKGGCFGLFGAGCHKSCKAAQARGHWPQCVPGAASVQAVEQSRAASPLLLAGFFHLY